MRAIKVLFVALVMVISLGLPATAAAQSAGDDQYADPFVEKQGQSRPAAPAPDDRTAPNRVVASPVTNAAAPAVADSGSEQLPRTGLNLVLLLVTGAVLLLSGFTVRRVLTEPYAAAR